MQTHVHMFLGIFSSAGFSNRKENREKEQMTWQHLVHRSQRKVKYLLSYLWTGSGTYDTTSNVWFNHSLTAITCRFPSDSQFVFQVHYFISLNWSLVGEIFLLDSLSLNICWMRWASSVGWEPSISLRTLLSFHRCIISCDYRWTNSGVLEPEVKATGPSTPDGKDFTWKEFKAIITIQGPHRFREVALWCLYKKKIKKFTNAPMESKIRQ